MSAAKAGDIAAVDAALAAGCDVNTQDEHGSTALARAVEHPGVVELLLNHGADPNIANEWQETPLDYACTVGNMESVVLLVQHGAEINHRDYQNRTALGEALIRGYLDIAEYLLRHGAIWSVAQCLQAMRLYVEPGLWEPDRDREIKGGGRDSPCSTRDYARFLLRLKDVSPDIDAALHLALKESLGLEGRRLKGVYDIGGFKCEILPDEMETIVLISNKKGSARFLLKHDVFKPAVKLVVNMGLADDDLEAASRLISTNANATHRLWKWHRFWRAIEAT